MERHNGPDRSAAPPAPGEGEKAAARRQVRICVAFRVIGLLIGLALMVLAVIEASDLRFLLPVHLTGGLLRGPGLSQFWGAAAGVVAGLVFAGWERWYVRRRRDLYERIVFTPIGDRWQKFGSSFLFAIGMPFVVGLALLIVILALAGLSSTLLVAGILVVLGVAPSEFERLARFLARS